MVLKVAEPLGLYLEHTIDTRKSSSAVWRHSACVTGIVSRNPASIEWPTCTDLLTRLHWHRPAHIVRIPSMGHLRLPMHKLKTRNTRPRILFLGKSTNVAGYHDVLSWQIGPLISVLCCPLPWCLQVFVECQRFRLGSTGLVYSILETGSVSDLFQIYDFQRIPRLFLLLRIGDGRMVRGQRWSWFRSLGRFNYHVLCLIGALPATQFLSSALPSRFSQPNKWKKELTRLPLSRNSAGCESKSILFTPPFSCF